MPHSIYCVIELGWMVRLDAVRSSFSYTVFSVEFLCPIPIGLDFLNFGLHHTLSHANQLRQDTPLQEGPKGYPAVRPRRFWSDVFTETIVIISFLVFVYCS